MPRKFSLVIGSGEGGQPSASLSIVPPPSAEEVPTTKGAVQLTIPALAQKPETLVSASLDGLSAGNLDRLLCATHARCVIDVRASPSFQQWRSASADFFRVLAIHHVSYQHIPELSNPFIAESWADTGSLDKYRAYLRRTAKPFVARLRAQLKKGPLVVISRSRRHNGSERECVVDELADIDGDFDLAIAEW